MSLTELVGLVRGLIGEVERLREENGKLKAGLATAKCENQQLKDEVRRLKGLPPRPPMKPSGMEKATDRSAPERPNPADASPPRRRGPGGFAAQGLRGDHRSGHRVQTRGDALPARALGNAGWADDDGRSAGGRGGRLRPAFASPGSGAAFSRPDDLRADRSRADRGRPFPPDQVRGSKRQVVRLLTAKLEVFRAEEEAVFSAGLRASGFVSVDDTGARHAGKACYTTQFGSDRFTAFRTGPSKSRLAFLRNLLGGTRYVVNEAAG